MCLIGLALDAHPRFGLVIAANRDEFFERPAAGLDWWRRSDDAPWLLAGRDLRAGGTWMGLSADGRVALLTNVRDPARHRPDAPSRGAHVPSWLESRWPTEAARDSNPFNLIVGDVATHRWQWTDDATRPPTPLASGLHGLSNASLDTPWPKVQRLKQAMAAALDSTDDGPALAAALLDALADRTRAADGALPDTGVGLERERMLSAAFIATADGRYGTRCSTVLIGERQGAAWHLRLVERSFDALGAASHERSVALTPWPGSGQRPPVQETRLS
jgi:uncharacterized protein with NRDE domain